MKGAKTPVFVEAKINAAVNEVVARPERGWPRARVIAEIEIPKAQSQDVIGLQRDSVKSHAPVVIGDVVTVKGFESEPGPGLEGEVGIEIGKGALVVTRLQTPIGVEIPVDKVGDFAVAFGLEFVVETEAEHIPAVDGINVVKVREVDGKQAQAGQYVIELRDFVSAACVRCWDEDVVDRRLNDVAEAIGLQQTAAIVGPEAGSFEVNLGAGIENAAIDFVGSGTGPVASL